MPGDAKLGGCLLGATLAAEARRVERGAEVIGLEHGQRDATATEMRDVAEKLYALAAQLNGEPNET